MEYQIFRVGDRDSNPPHLSAESYSDSYEESTKEKKLSREILNYLQMANSSNIVEAL